MHRVKSRRQGILTNNVLDVIVLLKQGIDVCLLLRDEGILLEK